VFRRNLQKEAEPKKTLKRGKTPVSTNGHKMNPKRVAILEEIY